MKRWGIILAIWLGTAAWVAAAENVCVIQIHGTIGPATASYISRAIGEAAGQNAQCLIIQLDTPGGLETSTKEIIQSFLRSPVPTVVYVSPSGAQAGSAGCFITIAADVAVMAPATAIGAAHPVSIGGEKTDDVMKQKLENFYGSYIEAVAAKHKRNAEWAKSSVRESAAITADKAVQLNVVDFIAKDMPDLLKQLDGRKAGGKKLQTAKAETVEIPMTTREEVFQVVAHPQMMMVLMLIVMYGVIGELTSPGAILPGVVGVIALVVLLYLASVIPINIAGLALVGVAIALFIIDVFAPTHGILTAGGIVAFFLGSFMMFDRSEPFLRLSLTWIIPATAVTALFFIFVVGKGLRAQSLPVKTGAETMIGRTVASVERIDATGGKVFIEGEYWNAVSETPVEAGQPVEVVRVEGLMLKVKPKTT